MLFDIISTGLCARKGSSPPVINPITITENGHYEALEGVDGYNPIDVKVPDRYDEGYKDGYNDGFKFTSDYYENVIDPEKQYYICVYLVENNRYPGTYDTIRDVYDISDLTEILAHFENESGPTRGCSYNAKITDIHWGMNGNYEALFTTVICYDKNGKEYEYTSAIDWFHNLKSQNSSVGRSLPN